MVVFDGLDKQATTGDAACCKCGGTGRRGHRKQDDACSAVALYTTSFPLKYFPISVCISTVVMVVYIEKRQLLSNREI